MIGSDGCLSPGRRQAIIWTNAGILLIGRLGKISVKSESKVIYVYTNFFLVQRNVLENDRKLAAILSWPQCVKHIQNDEILSMTLPT